MRLSAAGTSLSPSGALNVQVDGATGPRFPPTDGRLDATFGAQDVRVALNVLRGSKELASASAILGISARALADRAALAAAPLVLRAAVGPLRIQRDDFEETLLTGPPTLLSARLKAALSVDGTLNRPSLKMDVALDGAHLGKAPLGSARAQVTYAARKANLDIELRSVKGEAVRVLGATEVDLGYPQVTKGIDVAALPLEASLTARDFDLAWLSGLTDSVQVIGGALSASVTASGKIGQPQVKGRLEWTRGALGLTGLGNYRDVHLVAHGDRNALWLDELRLVSGDGWARATAKATRAGTGYQLASTLKLHRFPVYGQGQVLAVLSATSNLVGAGSRERAKVDVKLSDVHAELTDAKQKDLQPLGRPPDVILMSDGKPLDRAEAQEARRPASDDERRAVPAGVWRLLPGASLRRRAVRASGGRRRAPRPVGAREGRLPRTGAGAGLSHRIHGSVADLRARRRAAGTDRSAGPPPRCTGGLLAPLHRGARRSPAST